MSSGIMLGMVIKFLSGIIDYYQFYPYEGCPLVVSLEI